MSNQQFIPDPPHVLKIILQKGRAVGLCSCKNRLGDVRDSTGKDMTFIPLSTRRLLENLHRIHEHFEESKNERIEPTS